MMKTQLETALKVSSNDALNLILQNCPKLPPVEVSLLESIGAVLAEDVISSINSPSFDQVAMDGYAFAWSPMYSEIEYIIEPEISFAGIASEIQIASGSAVKVMTGAPLPLGADTVVPLELVTESNGKIVINYDCLLKGSNIRFEGSQCEKGDLVVKAGTKINSGIIGFLAGLGIVQVSVVASPQVGIIVTGSELTLPGFELPYGQVYESNSYILFSSMYEGRMEPSFIHYCVDDFQKLKETVSQAMNECDFLILTGGVSKGTFDYVEEVLESLKVEKIFHEVAQKPGKPMYFGIRGDVRVFGLPGNPFATLNCFIQYVIPAIKQSTGFKVRDLHQHCLLANDFAVKPGLTYFLKGKTDGIHVSILDGQESFMLSSFAESNCLVRLPEGIQNFKTGDFVDVLLLEDIWK